MSGPFRPARRWRRWSAALIAVVVALISGAAVLPALRGPAPVGAGGRAGLPDRLVEPPWWTETMQRSPNGPASVVFTTGIQADNEDEKRAWWRDGYSTDPSAVVGLDRNTYRIARDIFAVGVELSPDGRYLTNYFGDIVDLTTGRKTHVPGATTGTKSTWSAEGHWLLNDDLNTATGAWTTTVMAWPSLRVEWRVAPEYPNHGLHRTALSADGSLLAVQDGPDLRVYRRDGGMLWQRVTGQEELAGRAAWRDDGRLTLVRPARPVCPACPDSALDPYPVSRSLAFIDGLTGHPVTGPEYPTAERTLDMRVVAWRGETAYAVVLAKRGLPAAPTPGSSQHAEIEQVTLVRMDPGAATPHVELVAPDGTRDLNVATDYVGTVRKAGEVESGVNVREVLGWTTTGALCLSPVLAVLVLLFVRVRRALVRRSNRMIPADGRAT